MTLEAIDRWHKTPVGHFAFGLAELILAYIFASMAIDSGRLWEYALAFVLIFGGIRNWIKMFITHNHERKKHQQTR